MINRTASYVAFVVGSVRYAVSIAHVKEVMRPLPISAVPRAPSAVIGVADYRGEIAVVLDLRQHFDVPLLPADAPGLDPAKSRWIVLRLAALSLALVVDDVLGVVPGGADLVRAMPPGAQGVFLRDVVAAIPHQGQLVFLLDTERFHHLGESVRLMAERR